MSFENVRPIQIHKLDLKFQMKDCYFSQYNSGFWLNLVPLEISNFYQKKKKKWIIITVGISAKTKFSIFPVSFSFFFIYVGNQLLKWQACHVGI